MKICNFCKLPKEIPERPELLRFVCRCEENQILVRSLE